MSRIRYVFCSTALGVLLIGYEALLLSPAAGAAPSQAQITILYDAFRKPAAMENDWGFAGLVEYGGKRILFDTGDKRSILASNTKGKHMVLSKLDFAVLS